MLFNNPHILWFLLTVAVPIVIHLVQLHRHRTIFFSNVSQLIQMQTQSRRQRRVQEILILLCRCLVIVFLVFCFADPVIPRKEQTIGAGRTAVAVYIDNTLSSSLLGSEGSSLDIAKSKAEDIVRSYRSDDMFIIADATLRGEQSHPLAQHEALERIEGIEMSYDSPMLSQVVEWQKRCLLHAAANQRHAYIVSDFQLPAADIEACWFDTTITTTLVSLPSVAAENLSIDTLVVSSPAFFRGQEVTFEATIINHGGEKVEQLPVRLFINGQMKALATVDIAAKGRAVARMSVPLSDDTNVCGVVTIDDQPITFDDSYFFSLPTIQRLSVVEIYDENANDCLKRLFDRDSGTIFSRYQLPSLPSDIESYDMVILNVRGVIPTILSSSLASFVEGGGVLLTTPTADKGRQEINSLLASLRCPTYEKEHIGDVVASKIATNSELYSNVFATRQHNDEQMEMPTAHLHYSINSDNAIYEPLITLVGGDPLLIVTHAGRGKVYLFATTIDEQGSDMVTQALFVPTFFNMALYSRGVGRVATTLHEGATIVLHKGVDMSRQMPSFTDSNGVGFLPDVRASRSRSVVVLHDNPKKAGIYYYNGEQIALNYWRRESGMTFLSDEDIANVVEAMPQVESIKDGGVSIGESLKRRNRGVELWRWFAVLTLVMLACETLLLRMKNRMKDDVEG